MAAAEFTLKFCYLKPIYQKFTMVRFEKNSTCWEQVYSTGTKVVNQIICRWSKNQLLKTWKSRTKFTLLG